MTATDWSTPGTASGSGPGITPGSGVRHDTDRSVPAATGDGTATSGAGVARARGDTPLPSAVPVGLGPDQPLADVRPVGVLGVLDGGFAMLRFRFGRLVGVAALVLLPLLTVELVVVLRSPVTPTSDPLATPSSLELLASSSVGSGWGLVLAALGAVALTWVGLAVGATANAWVRGVDPTWGRIVRGALRRWWVAPVLTVVTLAVKIPAACLFGVGFFILDAFLFIAAVVAGAEDLGPLAAVGRSFRLTRRRYASALGICVGGMAITTILQLVVLIGPLLLVSWFGVGGMPATVVGQAAGLVVLVTAPLTACIAARAWVDFRCRVEGADLDARALRLGMG